MSGSSIATDRAALLLQLVPYLISKGEVSVAEAADEFDVTAEQMRTMVRGLTVIGLPGEQVVLSDGLLYINSDFIVHCRITMIGRNNYYNID